MEPNDGPIVEVNFFSETPINRNIPGRGLGFWKSFFTVMFAFLSNQNCFPEFLGTIFAMSGEVL